MPESDKANNNIRTYSVGELEELLEITRKTLFYYDRIGLLKPSGRTDNQNFKFYDEGKVARLKEILKYRNAGLKIAEIRLLLDGKNVDRIGILKSALERLQNEDRDIKKEIASLEALIKAEEKGY